MSSTVSFAPEARSAAVEVLRALSRQRRLFLIVAVLVTAIGVFVSNLLPVRYTALATVVVTPLSPDPLQPGPREEATLRDDEVSTQAALMASRDLALEVVRAHDVATSPGLAAHMLGKLCELAERLSHTTPLCRATPPEPPEGRAAQFLQRLRATPVPRTRLIELTYTDDDPAASAAALNALVELYQKQQIAQRTADLARTSNWISDRAEALRQTWLNAEARAGQFRTHSGLTPSGSHDASSPLVAQQVASAALSLSTAQAELSAAQARYAALRAAGTSAERLSFLTMRDEPGLVTLGTQLAQLRVQMADQRGQFSDNYPGLASMRLQIASLEKQIAAEMNRVLHSVEVEVQVKQSLVDNTQRRLRALRIEAADLNEQQVQLSTLEDQARSARTVFETFLGRAQQLNDRAGLLQPQVQFSTHAVPPDVPSFPNRPRLWLAAAMLALTFAFAFTFLREMLARGFSNISRVGDQLALPFLCAIPTVVGRRARRRLPQYIHDHPFSSSAEAMRTLLTQFQLRTSLDRVVKTVVIASATGQEGKTTTALWLASAAASGGSRVLLIDGDHRRGTVSQRLGGVAGPGFSNVVFGGEDVDGLLQRDEQQGFDFVPAGAPVSRSFSRADVDRLQQTIARLETRYDLIIIDTPPMLSMTDAFLYARLASGVVFLCRWSRTNRAAVSGCLARLRAAEANVLGIALSMVDESRLAQFSDELTRYDVRVMKRYYIG